MTRDLTRPAPARRPIRRRVRPRLTLGHLIVATAVAAPPLALIARAARDVEGAGSLALTALFAAGVVFELEVAFWVAFGPVVHPRLVGRPAKAAPDGEGIRWLDEPKVAAVGADPRDVPFSGGQ